MKRSRLVLVAAVAAGAMTLTSCSSDSSDANSAADGQLEKADVSVGVLPLADYAAVYWADSHGFFEKEGLNVDLQPLQGGAIGIQKVASGELDFTISNSISTDIAQSKKVPITTVAHTSSLGEGSGIVFVPQDSPIRSIGDLDGKTLGVNTTNSIGDVTFKNLAKSEGVSASPNFIEVPFPEMVAGVQAGSIEAGYAPEPFASAATAAGMRKVADLTTGPNKELATALFVSGSRFVKENPDTTAAFARAIYAAGADISAKESEFRAWLPGVAKVDPAISQSMVLPTFVSAMDLSGLEAVATMLAEQGLIPDGFDVAEYTYTDGS